MSSTRSCPTLATRRCRLSRAVGCQSCGTRTQPVAHCRPLPVLGRWRADYGAARAAAAPSSTTRHYQVNCVQGICIARRGRVQPAGIRKRVHRRRAKRKDAKIKPKP